MKTPSPHLVHQSNPKDPSCVVTGVSDFEDLRLSLVASANAFASMHAAPLVTASPLFTTSWKSRLKRVSKSEELKRARLDHGFHL